MKQIRVFLGICMSLGLIGLMLYMLPVPIQKHQPHAIHTSLPTQYAHWHYWDSISQVEGYEKVCRQVLDSQADLAKEYLEASAEARKMVMKKAKNAIFQGITQKLLPFWNETEWDFNGITREPNKGVIACGYFVATILQQAGIELDRRKMGQASSTDLVKAMCDGKSIQSFKKKNFRALWEYLSEKAPDGLYIIGLDKHAGLIAKEKEKVTFIHSRKPRLAGVIFEDAKKSLTLQNSNVHVIGNILENQTLIEKWLGE